MAKHYLAILPYRWLLKYRFRSDEVISKVKCPVFIFHGKRDPLVPYSSALRLYAAIPVEVHREPITLPRATTATWPDTRGSGGNFERSWRCGQSDVKDLKARRNPFPPCNFAAP